MLWKLTLVAEDVAPRFNVVAFGTLKVALRMVAMPVVAPITSAVATPAKLTVVAFVFNILNAVRFVVISPPSTFKSKSISTLPPTFKWVAKPTPPVTISAPVVGVVEAVVSPILIATSFAKFQSAPSISNLLSPASSYLNFTSLSLPKDK